MKKNTLVMTIRMGRQVERVRKGHGWKEVAGGETFAGRFCELVGKKLEITGAGVDLAGNPRMMEAVQWLAGNGYFQRG